VVISSAAASLLKTTNLVAVADEVLTCLTPGFYSVDHVTNMQSICSLLDAFLRRYVNLINFVSLTYCSYEFRVILSVNSDHFPKQHKPNDRCHGNVCFFEMTEFLNFIYT
jgi:hypothetical protein